MADSKKIIVGNWKMHGTPGSARALAGAIAAYGAALAKPVTVVLCPPFVLIPNVAWVLKDSPVKTGGQDCSQKPEGAFTGDVSAPMLKAAGCDYVIVGHSERRQHHRETSEDVRKKAAAAIAAGLIPIICIGETESERSQGKAEAVVGAQVKESLPKECGEGNFLLAYEPVWAIGTGKTPTVKDIQAMHAHALEVASQQTGLANNQISVLYGGSVKSANAKEILSVPGVSGALVGGASLQAEEFCKIVASG